MTVKKQYIAIAEGTPATSF